MMDTAANTDDRFVGMTGGEIFHEMMLRQGVKHVCKFAIRQTYCCPT